jgi:hypothetical protein
MVLVYFGAAVSSALFSPSSLSMLMLASVGVILGFEVGQERER